MRVKLLGTALLVLALTPPTFAFQPVARSGEESLRKLSDLQAEVELAIRNEISTRRDLERELREMEMLEVNRLIPEAHGPAVNYVKSELKSNLMKAAHAHGVQIEKIRVSRVTRAKKTPPAVALTTEKPTWFEDDAIAETIQLQVTGRGKESEARDVLLEVRPAIVARKLVSLGPDRWVAEAQTFRYRTLRLPALKAQDPARMVPASLLRNRPELAKQVDEIRNRIPESEAAFAEKARFMYYGARMSFFLRKVPPRP